jgi:hypothetical protein
MVKCFELNRQIRPKSTKNDQFCWFIGLVSLKTDFVGSGAYKAKKTRQNQQKLYILFSLVCIYYIYFGHVELGA